MKIETRYEVWVRTHVGGLRLYGSYRSRWRAVLAGWWRDSSLPLGSFLRGYEIRTASKVTE